MKPEEKDFIRRNIVGQKVIDVLYSGGWIKYVFENGASAEYPGFGRPTSESYRSIKEEEPNGIE